MKIVARENTEVVLHAGELYERTSAGVWKFTCEGSTEPVDPLLNRMLEKTYQAMLEDWPII